MDEVSDFLLWLHEGSEADAGWRNFTTRPQEERRNSWAPVDYAMLPPYVPTELADAAQAHNMVETSVDPMSESVSSDLVRTLIMAMTSASKELGRPLPYGDLDAEDLATSFRSHLSTVRRVRLTPRGTFCARQFADQDRIAASRQPGRGNAVLATLLRWIYAQQAASVPVRAVVGNFITPRRSPTVAGVRISMRELTAAANYTASENLCSYDLTSGELRVTGSGQRCVTQFGGDYTKMTRADRPGATYNTYLPNAKGVIIGEQQNFTQNNTDGVDPTLFVQLAGYVGQVSSTLGMPEPDRVELERVAQDLHDEATSENPEPGRLRQFATQLKDKLLEAGTTMAATMGVQMAEQALGTLM